jgi:hypothetical protein
VRLSNGNIASFTSIEAQLEIESGKKRYINPKIENELIEFKEEIEEKFWQSEMNKNFRFKRMEQNLRAVDSVSSPVTGLSKGKNSKKGDQKSADYN